MTEEERKERKEREEAERNISYLFNKDNIWHCDKCPKNTHRGEGRHLPCGQHYCCIAVYNGRI